MLSSSVSMISGLRRPLVATICLFVLIAAVVFVQSAPAPAPAGNPCVTPGVSIITDATGDTGTGSLGTAPGSPGQDITEILIAEPAQSDGVARLAITMRVADLTTLPTSGIWRVFMTSGGTTYFVGAFNDPTAGMQFNYGTAGTVTTTLGAADSGVVSTADKTITILISNSKVGNPGAASQLTGIYGRTQTLIGVAAAGGATPTHDIAPNTVPAATAAPTYTLIGNTACGSPPPPSPQPTPGPGSGAPRFQVYTPPRNKSFSGGEPSIGANWTTGNAMYLANFSSIRLGFDDCSSPAKDTWTDTHITSAASLDPILFTDHMVPAGAPNRTFVSQLTGQDSITFYTDDDGATYSPSQGGGIPSGVDHQTIGAGPYNPASPPPLPRNSTYPNAVYYCSQEAASAFCARSDDGGATFGAGVPIYQLLQCTGIHGHVKVAPDGTVYVPNRSCGGKASVIVSNDNGVTWNVRPAPPSSTTGFLVDPSVGIGMNNVGKPAGQSSNTIYLGYQASNGHPRIAVSHDQGSTWVNDQDVGTALGIQNSTFPEVVAGDDNRAAYAFLGTTVGEITRIKRPTIRCRRGISTSP